MSPDRITKIIPVARPVSLGGVNFRVWEFTLRDLATLQSYLDDEWTDPLDAIEERLCDPSLTDAERDDLLFPAHELAEQGPPIDGTAEGMARYATNEGVIAFLMIALRPPERRSEPFGEDETRAVVEVFSKMTSGEYLKLRRLLYGTSTIRTLTRLLMGSDPAGNGEGTWAQAIDEVAQSHGWTYQYIYSLTITEFVNARRDGKPVDDAISMTMNEGQIERYAAYLARNHDGVNVDG